jgi:hypothetical protein
MKEIVNTESLSTVQHITLLRQAQKVIAVAQVIHADDDAARQQFETVLNTSSESDVQVNIFTAREIAQAWLDGIDKAADWRRAVGITHPAKIADR